MAVSAVNTELLVAALYPWNFTSTSLIYSALRIVLVELEATFLEDPPCC